MKKNLIRWIGHECKLCRQIGAPRLMFMCTSGSKWCVNGT